MAAMTILKSLGAGVVTLWVIAAVVAGGYVWRKMTYHARRDRSTMPVHGAPIPVACRPIELR